MPNLKINTMDKYTVKITPRAFEDLEGIFHYLAIEKRSPFIAKRQTDRIKFALKSLDSFPHSHQERQEGRYAYQGYRQLLVDNYIAVFKIDENQKDVIVLTVQYQRRNI